MGSSRIPLTYPPNIDPTRATLAYGNWAPGRLKRELDDERLKVRQLAVYALSQYLHDPQNVAVMVRIGTMKSMKKLLVDPDETCRKVSAECVALFNTHGCGRQACIKEGVLTELEIMLNDKDRECRMSSHRAINTLSDTVEGCLGIIDTKTLLPSIGKFITKDNKEVKSLALNSIKKILMADIERARDQLTEDNLNKILHQILSHKSKDLTVSALDCLASMTFSRMALDTEEMYAEFTPSLIILLEDDNWQHQSKAALCLANICRYAKTKLKVINSGGLKLLMDLAFHEAKEVRTNALSAITRLAEHPIGRTEALSQVDRLKVLLEDPVAIVRKQAQIAINVITWKP